MWLYSRGAPYNHFLSRRFAMVGLRASSKSFARRYREKVATLAKLTGTVPAHFDAKSIHDLRVTIRRITVMIKLLPRNIRESGDGLKFQVALKSLLKSTADVRDSDILKSTLEAHLSNVPREIIDALEVKRKRAESAARNSMKIFPARLAPSIVQAKIDAKKLTTKLEKRVEKRGRTVQTSLVKATRDESRVEDLHKLRIEVKKLRYLLELAEGTARHLEVLTRWQDGLGEVHDLDVTINYLDKNDSGAVNKDVLDVLKRARHAGFRAFTEHLRADLKALKDVLGQRAG
jgi:CHAD domain-containing protein